MSRILNIDFLQLKLVNWNSALEVELLGYQVKNTHTTLSLYKCCQIAFLKAIPTCTDTNNIKMWQFLQSPPPLNH